MSLDCTISGAIALKLQILQGLERFNAVDKLPTKTLIINHLAPQVKSIHLAERAREKDGGTLVALSHQNRRVGLQTLARPIPLSFRP